LAKTGLRDPFTPCYFGPEESRLFGCRHEPRHGSEGKCGVVLCYPIGREYIFTHRAFRQLAILLSRAGFPVLRFDYYGCGDSSGEGVDGDLDRWTDDIGAAIDELRARCGIERICLAGFRLGATLAVRAALRRDEVEGLALWDPVVDGRSYLDDLIRAHDRWSRTQGLAPQAASRAGFPREILGFPLSQSIEEDLRAADLSTIPRLPARRVLLLASTDRSELGRLDRRLQELGATVDRQDIPWPEFWTESGDLHDVLMPPVRILQAIVGWGTGVCP
jgi:pimeloyl-ACP methyl ester carboxylesterase